MSRDLTKDLLRRAGLPSLNELVVKAVAMEAWKANMSKDGGKAKRNPIGQLVFDGKQDSRPTRSTDEGKVKVPQRGMATLVVHAASVWNGSPQLRAAKTKFEAKHAAVEIAKKSPL